AFILALENSVRGNNRTYADADKDDGAYDPKATGPYARTFTTHNKPVCYWLGAKNQLPQCMKAAYGAAHPDNIYEPNFAGPTLQQIAEWVQDYFKVYYFNQTQTKRNAIRQVCEQLSEDNALTPAQQNLWAETRHDIESIGLMELNA